MSGLDRKAKKPLGFHAEQERQYDEEVDAALRILEEELSEAEEVIRNSGYSLSARTDGDYASDEELTPCDPPYLWSPAFADQLKRRHTSIPMNIRRRQKDAFRQAIQERLALVQNCDGFILDRIVEYEEDHARQAEGKRVESLQICAFCHDPLDKVNEPITTLPVCGHAFHSWCIIPWLPRSMCRCPVCRRVADADSLPRWFEYARDVLHVEAEHEEHADDVPLNLLPDQCLWCSHLTDHKIVSREDCLYCLGRV